jgi:two-component system, NtrC family, response regulator HydG
VDESLKSSIVYTRRAVNAKGDQATTDTSVGWIERGSRQETTPCMALVVAWSHSEPELLAELVLTGEDEPDRLLGRGEARAEDSWPRLQLRRQRPPGWLRPAQSSKPISGPRISREQLRIKPSKARLEVERVGRCAMSINGQRTNFGVLSPGDTLLLDGELLLLCAERASGMPELRDYPERLWFEYGEADPHGIVGESPGIWALRDRLAFLAQREGHVLILGESGSGKELAARALHELSPRAARRLVSRNAATLPSGLIDAELFGNARNYPNAGMAERAGLIGEADGSTLFLDEIGELDTDLQAHLLRVLDHGGEYQRLGDATSRRADIRLIAATNRAENALKQDLTARLKLRVTIESLLSHREDIPLLARHLLRRAAARDPAIGERFFEGWNGKSGEPRLDPLLIDRLLRHTYAYHVRELEVLLWTAMAGSQGHFIALTPEVEARLTPISESNDSADLSAARIQECLDRHGGNQSRAYRELGLKNRDALYRLIKKHNLSVKRDRSKP